jgi:hypothetical protein
MLKVNYVYTHAYTWVSIWNPNSSTVQHYRPQHNCPATYVFVQQYSSATIVSQCDHLLKKKLLFQMLCVFRIFVSMKQHKPRECLCIISKLDFVIFLGVFVKLRNTTINFVMSARSTSCPHGTRLPLDRFSWNLALEDFSKYVEKKYFSSKSDKNNGYFAWNDKYTFMITPRSVHLRMRHFSYKICREIKKRCYSFIFENRAVYNMKKYGTARQPTDDNMVRFACWITKATNTHSEYVTLISFARQQWLRERASILHLLSFF